MAIIKWKTKEEIEEEKSRPVPPTEIEILQEENKILIAKVQANADLSDFHEELIVELAMMLY